jgi:hypothetical protein
LTLEASTTENTNWKDHTAHTTERIALVEKISSTGRTALVSIDIPQLLAQVVGCSQPDSGKEVEHRNPSKGTAGQLTKISDLILSD